MIQWIVGVHHLALRIGDATFAEHQGDLLAAAVAQVSDVFYELHRADFPGLAEGMALIASITLKPSPSPATRTWPKLAFNTAS